MTGIVATTLAVGVIATLMLLGIRMKLPPPDPDWREHLAPPPPPPTRLQLIVFVGIRCGLYLAGVIAALLQATGLSIAFMVGFFALLNAWVVVRVRAIRRARRELEGHEGESAVG